jgi:glycosyltransferase involved in cell wall biosynthesis
VKDASPRFSIVIASYNRAHILPRAVASVVAQTLPEWELIVVDDGSTDTTEELAKSWSDPRIRYVKLPENQGASAARNRGIEEAVGDFVLVWDSDDELYPEALQRVSEASATYPDAGVVSAPAIPMKADKAEKYVVREEGYIALPQILSKYLPNNEKVRAARRELYKEARYRSRNLDFMVNGYLARQAPWYHLKEPLGVLHIDNPDSLTRGRKKRVAARAIERAEYLANYVEDFGEVLKKTAPKRLAAHAYGAALGFFLAGSPERAARLSSIANDHAPGVLRYTLLRLAIRFPALRGVLSKFY